MARLSFDLKDENLPPYFLWDEKLTLLNLKNILKDKNHPLRTYYMGKIMREADYVDVWKLVAPQDVTLDWEDIHHHLGRRREFWSFLLHVWRKTELIH